MEGEGLFRINFYTVLGVHITATSDQIRSSYRKLARKWHPDRHRGATLAKQKFQEVQAAYEVLNDPQRRREYDMGLLELLDVEEYLRRFQDLILTPNGLDIALKCHGGASSADSPYYQEQDSWLFLTTV